MKILQTATMLAALISTGLMAGLFTGFAYAVMPGLNRSSDRTLIEAMQGINKAILNPAFMLPFMGSIPLIALAVFLAWRGHGHGHALAHRRARALSDRLHGHHRSQRPPQRPARQGR
ncbi:DUF1772 domain-containing protein [Actinomadura luteofluorescens]|uniref:anthrone oxygenase family protein n=1 Tax=Actinomadura luteofluorescens TaxID=46163 RepID=UPI00363E7D0E